MHRLRVVTGACTLQSSVALAATALLFVACLVGSGANAETISLGARAPNPEITSITGVDTSDARLSAVLTQVGFDACRNGDSQACSTHDEIPGKRYVISADCNLGRIVDVDGARYRRHGTWGRDDMFAGRPRFEDASGKVVPTANAFQGGALAVNYEILCPKASKAIATTPERSHGSQVPVEVVDLKNVAAEYFDHNGSLMRIDAEKGLIVYDTPKPSIRKSIKPGTVLFRGKPWDANNPDAVISGKARLFKAGCAAAEYDVRGHYRQGFVNVFTLEGASPVRSRTSCAITGASSNSPNAKLLFEPHLGAEL